MKNELVDLFHYAKAAVPAEPSDPGVPNGGIVQLIQKLYSVFPNLSKLSHIYKVQPPHTADCERDFSQMGLTKINIRNRMGEGTLDYMLRIIIKEASLEEFNFERAVKLWAQKKNRRYKIQLVLNKVRFIFQWYFQIFMHYTIVIRKI